MPGQAADEPRPGHSVETDHPLPPALHRPARQGVVADPDPLLVELDLLPAHVDQLAFAQTMIQGQQDETFERAAPHLLKQSPEGRIVQGPGRNALRFGELPDFPRRVRAHPPPGGRQAPVQEGPKGPEFPVDPEGRAAQGLPGVSGHPILSHRGRGYEATQGHPYGASGVTHMEPVRVGHMEPPG